MKKLIFVLCLILIVCLCLTCLSACNESGDSKVGFNQQIFDLNYKFDRAYMKIGDTWKDVAIKSWKDYDGEQIQITLEDGTVILTSSINCILYNGTLPK